MFDEDDLLEDIEAFDERLFEIEDPNFELGYIDEEFEVKRHVEAAQLLIEVLDLYGYDFEEVPRQEARAISKVISSHLDEAEKITDSVESGGWDCFSPVNDDDQIYSKQIDDSTSDSLQDDNDNFEFNSSDADEWDPREGNEASKPPWFSHFNDKKDVTRELYRKLK